MDFKKIKAEPSPSALQTTPPAPTPPTPSEKIPLDKARYFEGATADIFIQDETRPTYDDDVQASSSKERLPREMASLSSSSSHSPKESQQKSAQKTIELAHLSHMFQMPTQRVVSAQGSLLSQMKGDSFKEETALYAQYAAALAEMDQKKKKRKKRILEKMWDFFKSLFE